MLEDREQDCRQVGVDDLARFQRRLRNRGSDPTVVRLRPEKPVPGSTVDLALTAVMSFYRYFAMVGDVPAARRFYVHVKGGTVQARSQYASFLGHIGGGQDRRVIGRRRDPKLLPPFLTPEQTSVIKDDAPQTDRGQWSGDLCLRLLWTLLEETGLRLAEVLLRHRNWQPGTRTTACVEVQPDEDQRRRPRVKNQQYRRVCVSDGLYGEYLFLLTDLGVDLDDDNRIFITVADGHRAEFCDTPTAASTRCLSPRAWVV